MLADPDCTLSYGQIARAVSTSRSQIQRFADELREDAAVTVEYAGESTVPRYTPTRTDYQRLSDERDEYYALYQHQKLENVRLIDKIRELEGGA